MSGARRWQVAEALVGEAEGLELMGEQLVLARQADKGLGVPMFQDLAGAQRPVDGAGVDGAHQVAGEQGQGSGLALGLGRGFGGALALLLDRPYPALAVEPGQRAGDQHHQRQHRQAQPPAMAARELARAIERRRATG